MAVRTDDHVRANCFHPSGRFIEFPRADLQTSVAHRFRKIVELYPRRLAVKVADRALTYEQLDEMSDAISQTIRRQGDEQERPIVLLLDQGIDALVAMVGALKAGKCYVPLDPSFPISRIRLILEDCQATFILTGPETSALAADASGGGFRTLNLHDCLSAPVGKTVDKTISPGTPSFILYTSGSTGRPKGVIHTHRTALHAAMLLTNLAHLCAEDRLGMPLSYSFSASVRVLFGALLNGALLLPFNLKEQGIPALGEWLDREGATICAFTGSMFRQFLSHLGDNPRNYASLRLCFAGSESLSSNDVEQYKISLPDHTALTTNMGLNEAGSIRNLLIDKGTKIHGNIVPAGFAVDDKEILLLDDARGRVGFDTPGEIAVKSDFLSPGYWRQPELTAAKFIADESDGKKIYFTGDLGCLSKDGCLYFLGRKDFTVKIRGYNVDTPRVEMALLDHPGVRQVAVVPQEGRNGDIRLAAYIVPASRPRPSNDQLRALLRKSLPDYMIPSVYVELVALPLTPTGKIDRKSLPKPNNTRPQLDVAYVPFRNETERELTGIWEDALDVNPIGIHDNFFDLGGHSLTASQIVSRVLQRFQLQITLQDLFQAATVADMAAVITEYSEKRLSNEELKIILDELESLSDEHAQRLVHEGRHPSPKT